MTSAHILTVAILLFSSFSFSSSARILLYPYGHCLNSHLLGGERVAEILTEGGHEVDMLVSTAYTTYQHHRKHPKSVIPSSQIIPALSENEKYSDHSAEKSTDKSKNHCYKQGTIENCESQSKSENSVGGKGNLILFESPKNYYPVCEYDSLDFMLNAPIKDRFDALIDTAVKYCEAIIADKELMRRLKSTRYSVLVLESLDPCSRLLADYLDLPFVLLVTTGLGHFDTNPRPPSYLPAAIAPFTTSMNLPQRIANVVMKVMYDKAIPAYMGFMDHFEELKKRYQLNVTLSVENSFDRAALRLVNSDFSVEYPAPIEPDTVLVGGFGVGKPSKLPDDLQEFADSAGKDGLIVFSFGTLIRRYGTDWTELFLKALGRLPQRVIWRYTEEITNTSTIPENVKLVKWLPQVSLLAHPNTRLFISHCGLNALFEAAHFGVPVLALPLSGDQFNNAAKIAHYLKMGIEVDINRMTAESLYADLVKVLGDSVYAENAKNVASRLQDQPMTASDKILFWVNYVIRHKGANHLRSAAGSIPLYQYFCLDVIAVLFFGLLTFILCSYKLLILTVRLSIFCSIKLFNKVLKAEQIIEG